MSRRPLPTPEETRQILARTKTRPPMRPPPRASHKLQKFIKSLDEQFGRSATSLEARWSEIVGDRLSRVTQPVKIIKGKANAAGILELKVPSSAALFVQHEEKQILEKVNLFLGRTAVEKIRIQQGRIQAPAAGSTTTRVKSKTRPHLPPMPPAEEAGLEASVADLPEPLRKALTKLGKAAYARSRDQADDPYR